MNKKEWLVRYITLWKSEWCANTLYSWQARLKEAGFKDEADLDDTIKQTDAAIQRARNKELGIEENEEKVSCSRGWIC